MLNKCAFKYSNIKLCYYYETPVSADLLICRIYKNIYIYKLKKRNMTNTLLQREVVDTSAIET